MRLIFIRHAEPDYENNTLTEKGFREAKILANRTKDWKVKAVFTSPLNRAILTAKPTLDHWGLSATTYDWLQEFDYPVDDTMHPYHKRIAWDLSSDYLHAHPEVYSPDGWRENELVQTGSVAEDYDRVCAEFDALLASYGYVRDGVCYRVTEDHIPSDAFMIYDGHTIEHMQHNEATYTDDTLVFFCHLGVSMVLLSHLLNVSPYTLWQGFFTPPTAITVLTAEEKEPGLAVFRCQVCGDTSHLREASEPISYYGGFASVFQG